MTVTLNFILSLNFIIVNKYYFYSILNFFPQNNFLKIKFTKHNIIYYSIQFDKKTEREKWKKTCQWRLWSYTPSFDLCSSEIFRFITQL